MKGSFKSPFQGKQRKVKTFYCIGDDGVNNEYLYKYLEINPPEECQEMKITIKQLPLNEYFQIYDFPTDKMLRNALQIYFNILPQPDMFLYFLKVDSLPKDIRQWINLINRTYPTSKIVFVSDVTTYRERSKIISRVGVQFQFHILENICFSSLEQNSIQKMMADSGNMGIQIRTAVCLRPSLREKFKNKWKGLSGKVKKMIKKIGRNNEHESIV